MRAALVVLVLLTGCAGGVESSLPGIDPTPTPEPTAVPGPQPSAGFDEYVAQVMEEVRVPGLAAAIVKDGDVVWAKGYGYANVESQDPVTPETIFMLASISKTVVATAEMQLWEKGQLSLTDDAGSYLPFSLRNPAYQGTPISVRMLLTHTSTIADDWDTFDQLYVQGDSPISLASYLEDYLTPNGSYWNASHYDSVQPGSQWSYSNTGVDVAAYLVERIAQQPFDQYCEENVFAPLGIEEETSWKLAGLDAARVAMPYRWTGSTYEPHGHYGYPNYPNGQLRTSVVALGKFLAMYSQGGIYDGARVLEEATVSEIFKSQTSTDATQGILWYSWNVGGRTVHGHGGADRGVATEMMLDRETGIGVIVLMNGDWSETSNAVAELEDRLFDEAEAF